MASLSSPMEHGNGGDSRRGSTAFAGDSEQLGGWERPDEWDPLVSGPVRGEGCGLLLGCCGLPRTGEGREEGAGLRPSLLFF